MTRAKTKSAKLRRRVSVTLLAFAAFAIAGAVCVLYVEYNVFDSARFADNAQASLEVDEVRAVVVDDIGDLIVNEISQDAVAVRPLIDTISNSVIETAAFQRFFRSAVLQSHEAAINGETDDAVLTIANVGVLISQGLRQLSPQLADQIPDEFDDALLQIAEFDSVAELSTAADLGDDLAAIFPLLALLLVVLAFVVSPNRLRTLGQVGYALIVSGVLIGIAVFVSRMLVLDELADQGVVDREIGELIWETFMGGLFSVAIIVAALGAVIAAVGDGTLSGIRLKDRLANFAALGRVPERPQLRVLWSVGAIALGVLIALNPTDAAAVAAIVAGLIVLAAGLQELALMAVDESALPGGEGRPVRSVGERRLVRTLAIASVVGVFVVVSIGAIRVGGGLEGLGIINDPQACNGSRDLCDRPLNEVAIAATHNSMSVAAKPNWLFPAQEEPVSTQLADGIHGLLIDVYFAYPGKRVYTDTERSTPKAAEVILKEFGAEFVGAANRIRRSTSKRKGVDPGLFLCHGFCELGATPLAEVLIEVRDYLEKNPREVLVIVFEDYVPVSDLAEEIETNGLRKYAYDGPWGPTWPTLGKMIDDGNRLVLLTENAEPEVDWIHNAFQSIQETPFNFPTIESLRAPKSCDESRGAPENSVFLINHWVDTAPNPRPTIAARVNSFAFLKNRVERCQNDRQLLGNLIAVDFYRQGDLFAVVDDLNRER
ncbi:MAG: hypothetical protein ACPGWS_03110 [Solirubrobacterales bacterium]